MSSLRPSRRLVEVNDADYRIPFAFTGRIDNITLSIDRPQLSPSDIQKLQHAQRSKRTTE